MDGISINDSTLYAYSNGGVAIQSSTIGAPITTHNPEYTGYGLRDIISRYEWNVNAVSACVPVITIGDRVQPFRDHAELHAVSRASAPETPRRGWRRGACESCSVFDRLTRNVITVIIRLDICRRPIALH